MFDPNYNHAVSLADAAAMTKAYRDSTPRNSIISNAFGKTALLSVINQTGCEGIRFYESITEGIQKLVAVGVDTNGNDMTTGIILDRSICCDPHLCPNCATSNSLNTN